MAVGVIGLNGWHFPVFALGTTHHISNPSTSTQTSAFGSSTRIIRVSTTGGALNIAIGSDPTATSTSAIVPENDVEYFKVNAGEKLAALDGHGHGQGKITITEML
jgi:hypothetical protein